MTSRAAWQALPPALLPRVLRLWLKQEFSQDIPPSAILRQRLKNALGKNNGRGEIIPAGAGRQLFLDQNGLRHWQKPTSEPKCHQWNWQSEPCLLLPEYDAFLRARQKNEKTKAPGEILALESFDRAKLPENLQVRSWRPGDLMIPFGGDFRKKLQDLFTEAKIPRDQRSRIPILLAAEKIIWLPTVRRAEFARTEKQQEIIGIEYGKL